ncbi:MAG: pyridoxal phosphate-dependent aminotransferase family protein [Flavobacteriaceae bacterium]|nr:pyridoxal phosphate-dependent aminotransferase family protein [Flavobacteriaceae bacterium]
MNSFPQKLHNKLKERKSNNAFRVMNSSNNLIDFSSNDYLGFSVSEEIYENTNTLLSSENLKRNGAKGSRLLTGNYSLYNKTEEYLSKIYRQEAALLFNSGYDANLGLLSSIAQRGDVILYDELIHASLRDGISMSHARAYKFKHNDLQDVQTMCKRIKKNNHVSNAEPIEIYLVTESVFSMDGDSPDLKSLVSICEEHSLNLIIDEAHALGVYGLGLVHQLNIEDKVFATILTFGKGLGCHGAAILGSTFLKEYLVNFSRSFIYTTALPPHSVATINTAFQELVLDTKAENSAIKKLNSSINIFKTEIKLLGLDQHFIESNSAIQCCIISGNEKVKSYSEKLKEEGYDVKAILSPTVSEGKERLRFCLHSYNSEEEIKGVLKTLKILIKK